MTEWRWHGHAAHFIGAHACRFRMATSVGNVVVSTVGDYVPKGAGGEPEDIGYRRKFETMVFTIDGAQECGCPKITDYAEIDADGYQTAAEAEAGHYAMCRKWDEEQEQDNEQ